VALGVPAYQVRVVAALSRCYWRTSLPVVRKFGVGVDRKFGAGEMVSAAGERDGRRGDDTEPVPSADSAKIRHGSDARLDDGSGSGR
jgi:hypothetical protein